MAKVGIIGASGYTGAELLRLCAGHPELDVVVATGETQAGTAAADLYPSLAPAYPDLVFSAYDRSAVAGLDIVFLGLPHTGAEEVAPELLGKVHAIIDLSAAFRLKDASLYLEYYGGPHPHPELLQQAVYGLPEFFRTELSEARLVAAPGCYVTAAALALRPLVLGGAVDASGIIVDAASGVSGAGRSLKPETAFNTVDEDFTAYGLLNHRHTPEIEQATGAQVLFTPHLAPMNRGILATCYARPAQPLTTDDLLGILHESYDGEPFVVVSERSPSTKATLGSNSAHITARLDPRTHWVVVIAALDNLVKGASGQAIQCANVVLGLPETSGLPSVGMYP
ncbi:MAG TPA: N-acetyl-gamma-glutamyl-phosphate reductase [Acidimicrobiales bacterium]|nr:N-acetyl-gamma-glutamyl-phosphate reductase [Acidimicrobiales bacterium]